MIKVDKETPLNSLLSHLEEAWFLSVVGDEALLYGPGGETEGPWPQEVYEPLIKDGSLVAFADDKYVLRRYLALATAATPPDFTSCDFSQTAEEQSEISSMIDVSTHNHFFVSGVLWGFVSYDSPEYEKALVDNPEYTGPVIKEVATTRDIIISGLNHYIPSPGDRELESLTQDVFEELKEERPTNV